jgi:hypothetical protein
MADGKKIGATGAAAVAAVLGGKALVATVHEAGHIPVEAPVVAAGRSAADAAAAGAVGNSGRPLGSGITALGSSDRDLPGSTHRSGDYPSSAFDLEGEDKVALPPTVPRSLIVVPSYNFHLTAKVHGLYEQAEPRIIADITDSNSTLTKRQIDSLINKEIVSTINADTKKSNSDISFEVLTGKLKIHKSKTVLGIDVSAGEVNIYKVSAILASGVCACQKLSTEKFRNCVDAAVANVGTIVAKEIRENAVASSNG